jgi:hypothetical protein
MKINEALETMSSLFTMLRVDGVLLDDEIEQINEVETTIYNFVKENKHD